MATIEVEYPLAIYWSVNKSDLNTVLKDQRISFRSKEFHPSTGTTCSLSIYPFGRRPENKGHTWLFFHFDDYTEMKQFKDDADIVITISSANWEKEFKSIYKHFHGWALLCSTKDFFDSDKGFFVDNIFRVTIKGCLKVKEPVVEPNEIISCKKQTLGTVLWECDDDDKDFKIAVHGQNIHVHKHILAAYSPVFAAMFRSKMQESINNYVDIPNYPFEVIEIIVKICYDVDVPGDLLLEHKTELFEFVDQYQMDNLKDDIEKFLMKKISAVNVCSLANCSVVGRAPNLQTRCYNFLMRCLKSGTPVADLEILNKDLKVEIFDNAFISIL